MDSGKHLTAEQAVVIIGVVATSVRNIVTRMLEKSVADDILAAVNKAIRKPWRAVLATDFSKFDEQRRSTWINCVRTVERVLLFQR
jgi:hypothetical protein